MLKLIRDKSCNSVSIILVLTLRGLAVILSDVMMVLAIRYDIRTCNHHYLFGCMYVSLIITVAQC